MISPEKLIANQEEINASIINKTVYLSLKM